MNILSHEDLTRRDQSLFKTWSELRDMTEAQSDSESQKKDPKIELGSPGSPANTRKSEKFPEVWVVIYNKSC